MPVAPPDETSDIIEQLELIHRRVLSVASTLAMAQGDTPAISTIKMNMRLLKEQTQRLKGEEIAA